MVYLLGSLGNSATGYRLLLAFADVIANSFAIRFIYLFLLLYLVMTQLSSFLSILTLIEDIKLINVLCEQLSSR